MPKITISNGILVCIRLVLLRSHSLAFWVVYSHEIAIAADESVIKKIAIPKVSDSENARDDHISYERAMQIIDHRCRYEWASTAQTVSYTRCCIWVRHSLLDSLDVDDWYFDKPYLAVQHRSEQGTALNLKAESEEKRLNRQEYLNDT